MEKPLGNEAAGPAAKARSFGRRLLGRGESALASIALATATSLLAAMATCGFWAGHEQRETLAAAREEQLQIIGTLLSQNVESMLNVGDLSGARRLLVDSARNWNLLQCRIVLGTDQIVADSDPRRINVRTLPASWTPSKDETGRPAEATDGDDQRTYPISITGRGTAMLELASAPFDLGSHYWNAQSGIGIIGAGTLLLFLFLYRRLGSRLRALWVVRDALLAAAAGDRSPERLAVDDTLGREAVAWNQLLVEARQARQKKLAETAAAVPISNRRSAAGDLEAACDAMVDGLILVDARGCIKFANGAAGVYLKVRRDAVLGHELAEFVSNVAVLDAVRSVMSGAVNGLVKVEVGQGEKAAPGEASKVGTGEGVLRFNIRPVRKGDGAAAMIIVEDITQRRVADEARNSFVSQVAHELRTPLTNIRLYVESAIDDGASDPSLRESCLSVISAESLRLERIVGEMLSVSEIEAGSLRIRKDDVRMDVLLQEISKEFQVQAASKKITLDFDMPPKLPVLQGDRDKIALTLHNLIGNALKYTPEGGMVCVTPEERKGMLAIEVSDTGIGIKEEEAALIFDRFYRAKDPRISKITGTGLGLTLAREVARLHGGDVTVQSQLNKGSSFTLTLPIGGQES